MSLLIGYDVLYRWIHYIITQDVYYATIKKIDQENGLFFLGFFVFFAVLTFNYVSVKY